MDGIAIEAVAREDTEEGTLTVDTTAVGLAWALETALAEETMTDWTDDWAEDGGAADEEAIGSMVEGEGVAEEKEMKLLSGGR